MKFSRYNILHILIKNICSPLYMSNYTYKLKPVSCNYYSDIYSFLNFLQMAHYLCHGRPICTTDRDRRNLCLEFRRHSFLTAREVQHSLLSMPNMSIRTARRILSISGLHGRIAGKKPLLSCTHIGNRLSWCKTYLQMDPKL